MSLTIVTPPATLAVSLERAKEHLAVEHALHDVQILAAIETAQALAEQHTMRRFITQTLAWAAPDLCCALPLAPVDRDTITVEYIPDSDSEYATWAGSNYLVRTRGTDAGTVIFPKANATFPTINWETDAPIKITFTVGRAEAPAPVCNAILLMVGDLYKARETFTTGSAARIPMSTNIETLLGAYVWCH